MRDVAAVERLVAEADVVIRYDDSAIVEHVLSMLAVFYRCRSIRQWRNYASRTENTSLPLRTSPLLCVTCITGKPALQKTIPLITILRQTASPLLSAVEADVLLMNEIGLDPGIDHCSALSLMDTLRAQNKEIVSFTSFCGGLPAPEHADVPLGYKFSWSPKGVLTAAGNAARFKLRGEVCIHERTLHG